ncbi:MAG: MBOAT family O-acyltransferase [Candidatus Hodarchaeota archaeon]
MIASYYFYAWWDYRFVALMAFSTLVNYFAGMIIHNSKSHAIRKFALIFSICLSLSTLFFFKYLPWLGSYITIFLMGDTKQHFISFISKIILPVGISFFTFQAMSYPIDLYKGKCNYCPSILRFSTFVSMFPQLVAGPIIRFSNIDNQLDHVNNLDHQVDFQGGMDLFFRGLIKKVIFADRIGLLIDPFFVSGAHLNFGAAWISILGYSLQIYFDFSGYSDMAIGMGKCMGFKFPDNFLAPYTSSNPSEFWKRWHITLSTWLRDYVYIPLGGNRHGKEKTLRNLMLTMLIGGLWHGASWTFVFWGFWHGLVLITHKLTPSHLRDLLPRWISILLLNLVVLIGWVFFRMKSISQAFYFLTIMLGIGRQTVTMIPWPLFIIVPIGYILHFFERYDYDYAISRGYAYAILLAFVSSWSILELGKDTPFIYFQF